MRSKTFIGVAGVIVVLLALAGGVAAYDSSQDDTIAKGVKVGGVDVGGLTPAAAREKLQAALAEPLNRPVVASYGKRDFTLTPETSGIGVDIERSVAEAMDRSREGNILGRTLRGLTGGEIDEDLEVSINYDRDGVSNMVRRVRDRLDQKAVDAKVDFLDGTPEPVKSRTGIAVDVRALRRAVVEQLTTVNGTKTVKVPVEATKPKVTTKQLAGEYPSVLVVDRPNFTLRLYRRLKVAKKYTVAIGQVGLETPAGRYEIQNKAVNPTWTVPNSAWAGDLAGKVIPPGPENPLKSRWLGIYDGAGIHGTDAIASLGTAASHGCVRMAIPDVEELYELVDVGTPIYII